MPLRAAAGLLAIPALLCGCTVRPIETAQAFCRAIERRDLGAAGSFCLPALRAELTNAPSALRVFTLHATNVACVVRDIRSGGDEVTVLLDIEVAMDFPPPGMVRGQLVLSMARRGGRWYFDRGDASVPRYVELCTARQDGGEGMLWNLSGVRYGSVQSVDEPVQVFVRRVDRYCRSFEP